MSKGDIISRARVISDSLAKDVEKAYARRAVGKKGPITVNELPEDAVARVLDDVTAVAPVEARKAAASKFSRKSYALVGGGTIAGATLFNLDDLGFIDAILSLTPESQGEVVEDAAAVDAETGSSLAQGTQLIGDFRYIHEMSEADTDGHRRLMPVDRSIVSGVGIQHSEVEKLQAYTDVLELAIQGVGSLDALEAIIFLSNNTSPEDRFSLFDNLQYRRGR